MLNNKHPTLSWDLNLLRQKPESGREHTSPRQRMRGEKQRVAVEKLTEATRGGKAELNVGFSDQETEKGVSGEQLDLQLVPEK